MVAELVARHNNLIIVKTEVEAHQIMKEVRMLMQQIIHLYHMIRQPFAKTTRLMAIPQKIVLVVMRIYIVTTITCMVI